MLSHQCPNARQVRAPSGHRTKNAMPCVANTAAPVTSSFLLLLVRHLFLVAMHLLLVASTAGSRAKPSLRSPLSALQSFANSPHPIAKAQCPAASRHPSCGHPCAFATQNSEQDTHQFLIQRSERSTLGVALRYLALHICRFSALTKALPYESYFRILCAHNLSVTWTKCKHKVPPRATRLQSHKILHAMEKASENFEQLEGPISGDNANCSCTARVTC